MSTPQHRAGQPAMRVTANKAVAAFAFALAGSLGTAMLDGSLTAGEAIASVGFALVTGAATYKTRYQVPS